MSKASGMGRRSLLVTGIVLLVLGLLLLASPIAAGAVIIKAVAAVLVLTGVVQLFQATKAPAGTGRIIALALGVVVAGLGVMVWINPEIGSGFLLALLMMFFVVNGLWQLTTAWRFRTVRGWFWLLLCGLVSMVFVYLLWSQWPLAGAWVIGVFIGINLLLTGAAMVVLATALGRRSGPSTVETIDL
jgi:uncharacterized membrane protein HdeD (DUF308 family)